MYTLDDWVVMINLDTMYWLAQALLFCQTNAGAGSIKLTYNFRGSRCVITLTFIMFVAL